MPNAATHFVGENETPRIMCRVEGWGLAEAVAWNVSSEALIEEEPSYSIGNQKKKKIYAVLNDFVIKLSPQLYGTIIAYAIATSQIAFLIPF